MKELYVQKATRHLINHSSLSTICREHIGEAVKRELKNQSFNTSLNIRGISSDQKTQEGRTKTTLSIQLTPSVLKKHQMMVENKF